jgi:hypothetical protein
MDPVQNSSVPLSPAPGGGNDNGGGTGEGFVSRYVHYLTGKEMIASEYGYKAWHFKPKKK